MRMGRLAVWIAAVSVPSSIALAQAGSSDSPIAKKASPDLGGSTTVSYYRVGAAEFSPNYPRHPVDA